MFHFLSSLFAIHIVALYSPFSKKSEGRHRERYLLLVHPAKATAEPSKRQDLTTQFDFPKRYRLKCSRQLLLLYRRWETKALESGAWLELEGRNLAFQNGM